ncbi:glycoside hydrolase domain-containing protein [Arcanobacterium hippocoleae]|uniref:Peptidoglycan hydrolase-like protein with peptidoglycan-binding domain n=1 Tax=Arcanobacterium hippocoleae TaxID=149017 RepID=A0ABU1SZC7_9ACTO|nr:glycoside hydrolase domain-containing protein [Arcanobacterium hippocoleae]MDR6938484.1 peptidoglycan hydrolase-like protein with peptidoglycan-binding domain [Arcanobacterium hippocoleae]
MTDQMVLATQKWLNETYRSRTGFGSVEETGKTGWATIYALIRALQIELGITATANNFGSGTQSRFKNRWPNGIRQTGNDDKVYGIIQGALWCKGYPAEYGGITTKFTDNVASSIRRMKSDIGLSDTSATVDLEMMMALLSMKQFRLLAAYGGKTTIRTAQQAINRNYKNYTGIVPTDGLYSREMNKALIQVLQSLQGFTPTQATGNFGSGTRSRLRTISSGTSQWVWLASVALVCNGYQITPTESWSSTLTATIRKFQQDYALPVTGVVDPTTWMSLLTSKGDPDRDCVACDTRFEITEELAQYLKADGYQIVGRYLTEPGMGVLKPENYFKALRPGELERIVKHGLKYFPIFQEYSTKLTHFTVDNGHRHAKEAQDAAQRLGVPPTIIYFAVDYDATDPEVTSHILPYFEAVAQSLGGGYRVGIYASRNICTRVSQAGYAAASFVSDMSTGFSGNLGFPIPENWVFDQFHEISGYRGKWDLDRVAYSRAATVCSTVERNYAASDPLLNWVKETESQCLAAMSGFMNPAAPYKGFVGEFILEWLRKPEYWSQGQFAPILWKTYTPEIALPAELVSARLVCAEVCGKQPTIKGTLSERDIAHMAATTLGYLTWGADYPVDEYGLGDLGGWPLDLLQIWGQYQNNAKSVDLYSWVSSHLGSPRDGQGFGYADVLADADAWLIARYMKQHSGEHSLSQAMEDTFKDSETNRIKRFYKERFAGSADNLVAAFQVVTDGIDAMGLTNIVGTQQLLELASHASSLPNAGEAEILARAYAAFLASPNR